MAYSQFTIESLKRKFGLTIDEKIDIFAAAPTVAYSDLLTATLKENVPLALAISTEKARSEMIITPMLIEARRLLNHEISLFSGIEFNIDKELDLQGFCDYIISLSAEQISLSAPVVTLVEAKNEDMRGGLAQCIAEMVAARMFNQQQNNALETIFGVVTTGSNWKFLKLHGQKVFIDLTEYYIKEPGKILGILLSMIQSARAI